MTVFKQGFKMSPALLFYTGRKPVPASYWFLKGTVLDCLEPRRESRVIMNRQMGGSSHAPHLRCAHIQHTLRGQLVGAEGEAAIFRVEVHLISCAQGWMWTGLNTFPRFFPITLPNILPSAFGFQHFIGFVVDCSLFLLMACVNSRVLSSHHVSENSPLNLRMFTFQSI